MTNGRTDERYSQVWPKYFGQNGSFLNLRRKSETVIFRLQILGLKQNIANSKERIARKMRKPPFVGIWGQNGQFWTVFGQNGQNRIFSKKRIVHFSRLQAPN